MNMLNKISNMEIAMANAMEKINRLEEQLKALAIYVKPRIDYINKKIETENMAQLR